VGNVDSRRSAARKASFADQHSAPESPIRDDPELDRAGWLRRHLVDPERARESTELYESLGFEVHRRELKADDFGRQCHACAAVACQAYVILYTRRKVAAQDQPAKRQDDGSDGGPRLFEP